MPEAAIAEIERSKNVPTSIQWTIPRDGIVLERSAIEGIQHLEIGRDELHDARSWSLVLIMEFASFDALRAYQRHPQHLALMAFNDPFVENVASVDFTAAGH